jgi:hypothetical protein
MADLARIKLSEREERTVAAWAKVGEEVEPAEH